jgi:hypothetical protein
MRARRVSGSREEGAARQRQGGWAGPRPKRKNTGDERAKEKTASRPNPRKKCRMNRNLFLFSKLIFQIKLSNVFEYLLNFDSNQSSQKFVAA